MSRAAPIVDRQPRRAGMPGLKGRNVLVTGGSSGIGQAIAVRFAECDPQTFSVDVDHVRSLIGPRTRAVVVVHIGGIITPRIAELL